VEAAALRVALLVMEMSVVAAWVVTAAACEQLRGPWSTACPRWPCWRW